MTKINEDIDWVIENDNELVLLKPTGDVYMVLRHHITKGEVELDNIFDDGVPQLISKDFFDEDFIHIKKVVKIE